MTSIVGTLWDWVSDNREWLRHEGVRIDERFPVPGSNERGKATIGLSFKTMLISYTVWENVRFQIEYLAFDGTTGDTVVVEDKETEDTQTVRTDLDRIVSELLSGKLAMKTRQ